MLLTQGWQEVCDWSTCGLPASGTYLVSVFAYDADNEEAEEVALHRSGHAGFTNVIRIAVKRRLGTSGGRVQLVVASAHGSSGTVTTEYRFAFQLLMRWGPQSTGDAPPVDETLP